MSKRCTNYGEALTDVDRQGWLKALRDHETIFGLREVMRRLHGGHR